MAKKSVAPKPTEAKPLTLADVDIVWNTTANASGKPTAGVSLIPALLNDGLDELYSRALGLHDLLEGHECIADESLIFVRATLLDLANRLYVFPDDRDAIASAARYKIVVREQQPVKTAVA
jgi:hypothetical protein